MTAPPNPGERVAETAETILARFADAYKEHGAGSERRLTITFEDGRFEKNTWSGYITDRHLRLLSPHDFMGRFGNVVPYSWIVCIDYSNAKHRTEQPLYVRSATSAVAAEGE